jgi:hypothetical protein
MQAQHSAVPEGQMEAPTRKHLRRALALLTAICCMLLAPKSYSQPQNGRVLISPRPPALLAGSACTVGLLNLRITTGNDDLRGGKNNLDVEVHFANGDMQTATNVNKGASWPSHSVNLVPIQLKNPIAPTEIRQIRLVHSAQGGYIPPSAGQVATTTTPVAGPVFAPIGMAQGAQSEDNWDMTELQAFGLGKAVNVPVASFGFHRFTGSNPSLDVKAQPGLGCPSANQVRELSFTFSTTDDDLRGGNDNLNVTILFADGTTQAASNINHSQNWHNGSTKGAEVLLNRPVTIDQIRGIMLATTFTGGSGGDNWNMGSMQADAVFADGSYRTIAKSGFHRFSADWSGPKAKEITIAAHVIN